MKEIEIENKTVIYLILICLWIITTIFAYDKGYSKGNSNVVNDTIVKETIEYITVIEPVAYYDTIVKIKYKYLKPIDTIKNNDIIKDSILVEVPISQKIYKDSNYVAYVSGYEPNLDSISLFAKSYETIIYQTIGSNCKKVPFVVGYFGVGINGNKEGIYPGVQVGVGINLNRLVSLRK